MSYVHERDADQFRVGDVWETVRGSKHRVVDVMQVPGRPKEACLKNVETGKRSRRSWDAVWGWVRVESGPTTRDSAGDQR